MVQVGIHTLLIIIGLLAARLIFPLEFMFSTSLASTHMMPFVYKLLHTSVIGSMTIMGALLIIWIIGMAFTAFKTIRMHILFRQIIRQLPVLNDVHINKILQTITQDGRKPITFQVLSADFVNTPMLYGFRQPKIIIPSVELTDQEWYFILKHEVTHYYNRDLYVKTFIQLLLIIYWWNPFVYLLNTQMDKMLEMKTDLEATKDLNAYEKTQYLDCLLMVAKSIPADNNYNAYSIAFGYSKTSVLSQRFHLILGLNKPTLSKYVMNILMSVLLIILLYFSFIIVFEPYAIAPEDAAGTVELTTESSYLIINPNGGYDVYINHEFFATTQEIQDSFSDLTVYNTKEEALEKRN
jgi:beta-lactamase regulating signal transducer with metallopeptidase domain